MDEIYRKRKTLPFFRKKVLFSFHSWQKNHPVRPSLFLFEKDAEDQPERKKIQSLVHELHSRGYRYGDIAVLTQKNEDAVRVTTWLNEVDIRFISYSSLDIRRRKITGEIVF
jgi:ATP-dependent exoDNAse (exonuclease V) beta subunit